MIGDLKVKIKISHSLQIIHGIPDISVQNSTTSHNGKIRLTQL